MDTPTPASLKLREKIRTHRSELEAVMRSYGADNLRLFGSVARGDARDDSDIDLIVDLDPANGSELMRVCGLSEEFRQILNHPVDVVAQTLLRDGIRSSAQKEAVPL